LTRLAPTHMIITVMLDRIRPTDMEPYYHACRERQTVRMSLNSER